MQAVALVRSGRPDEAIGLLDRAGARGDGAALLALALWRIEGRLMVRDLKTARAEMERAAALGELLAARALAALLATGSGAERDWAGALRVLEQWRQRDEEAGRQRDLIAAMSLTDQGDPLGSAEREVLSADPYVARFPALFTTAECAYLARLAEPRFKPARIFHEGQRRFVADPLRDSEAAGFPLVSEWPAVHALNRRLAAASGTDVRQGETLQVLRYRPGQQYKPHLDAIAGLANQRVLTFLVYLNEDYAGGETDFPEAGLRVAGRTGMGLLFANALPDGRADPRTRHAGLPVTRGEKLAASRWIRARPPEHPDGFGRHEAEAKA